MFFYEFQIDERMMNRVLDFIESGKKEGARLETGGSRVGAEGYFVQATVFSNVTDNMTIAKEEVGLRSYNSKTHLGQEIGRNRIKNSSIGFSRKGINAKAM